MSFTNDDLKRLKDNVALGGWSPKMSALLGRFDASEAVCRIVQQSKYAPGSALDVAIQKWLIECGELKLAEGEKVPGAGWTVTNEYIR